MKIKLTLVVTFLLTVISVKAQIYTPSGIIQGASSNNNIGIGATSPLGKLDVFTGLTGTTSLATLPTGTISFGNNNTTLTIPTIFSKSSNGVGMSLFTGTNDVNEFPDMRFTVMEEDGTDFTTKTSSAFRFARFNVTLFDILRNGNIGIGTSAPIGKLDIVVGTVNTFNPAIQADGSISILNAGAGVAIPAFVGKSVSGTGLYHYATTLDTNPATDMHFNVRTTANGDFTTLTNSAFRFSRFATVLLDIKRNGRIGIGTSNPAGALHVVDAEGGFFFDGLNTEYNRIKSTAVAPVTPKPLLISAQLSGTTPDIYINTSGNVGVGTMNPTSKFTVAGNINSREVKVTVDAGADFVFENNYNLPSLDAVAKYIKENKHLPEIASADKMKKEGINLSEMNIKLLQKIEELTLYTIEQQKHTDNLTKVIEALTKRLEAVEQK